MAYLGDTSLLLRLANTSDVQYPLAYQAVQRLHRQSETIHLTPQNLVEFRNVATRPLANNGLGLTVTLVEQQAVTFEQMFPLLVETPDIYPAWKTVVHQGGVIGKQVHDARIVAVCIVYQITHLLTFDIHHFTRLAAPIPGLTVVHPQNI